MKRLESFEETAQSIPDVGKNCALCIHFPTCGIIRLYGQTIEPNFPDTIESNNLAWICKQYREGDI